MIKKPELLAPAGDLERLKFAIWYGADAVYIGGTLFGLRANASNFTLDEIKEACDFAHPLNRKIYVTVNIALHSEEIKSLTKYLIDLDKIGVDAIIIKDPAVISPAKKHTNLEIHLSTQQSTLNKEACLFWEEKGIKRIVLAREASKEEIEDIIKNVDIEIETFIHGAMCCNYSGRCVLSNVFTLRDANRGGCAQICRWSFRLYNENKKELVGNNSFTFCTKDLSSDINIPKMMDLGISSFKIEGRMRSVYYIATVVGTYRKIIDDYYHKKDTYEYNYEYGRILSSVANRDSLSQFFLGNYGMESQYYNEREEVSNQDFLGIVLDYDEKSKMALLEQRNYFKKGDTVEFFGPITSSFEYVIDNIIDENDDLVEVVRHPKQTVQIYIDRPLNKNDMMRKKRIDKK